MHSVHEGDNQGSGHQKVCDVARMRPFMIPNYMLREER